MYVVTALIKLNKNPESDEISGIADYYREVLKRRSSQYKVLDLSVKADDDKNFHVYMQLDIPEEEGKEKSVFNIVRELEEYYKSMLKEASLQFGGAEIYTSGGKTDETK